tara:strand:+ start:540 stop:1325 length:786 start_codon:yes stop_codon:yes gene_type:complete
MRFYKISNKKLLRLVDDIDIKKNDIVLLTSNILPILTKYKNIDNKFLNSFIDSFINKIGKGGTLLLPTFSWDFCKGLGFHYYDTKPQTGALSKLVLERKDFLRTKHPIYSFAVWGKYKKKLYNIDTQSGWSKNSIFGFLYHKNAKNLFVGLDYKDGFTFDHFIEEKNKVNYRFFKFFKGSYVGRNRVKKIKKYKMFVRDPRVNGKTEINNKLDKIMIKNNCYKKYMINKIPIGLINLKIAGDIINKDMKSNGGLIFSKKIQ